MNSAKVTMVAMAMIFVFAAAVKAEDPVYFADANLKVAVVAELQKTDPTITDPTPTDMLGLDYIQAPDRGITELTGLEFATNLYHLELQRNQIIDISALSGMTKLKFLWLDRNQIIDISALSGMTDMDKMRLSSNQIIDISALSGMTKPHVLHLENNQIIDISPLSGMNLRKVYLETNQISDISVLSSMNEMTSLNLSDNQISDFSALSGLINLTSLNLYNNQISDISPLSGLINLTSLDLTYNQISDISALSGLINLTKLYLQNNQINDISALSGLINLTILYLQSNQINNISPLSGLINLTILYLYNNQISDISPLSGLINLQRLHLAYNQISDISALSGLTNLVRLDLMANPLNSDACTTYIPQIIANNLGITLMQDACPDPGSLLVNGGFESGAMAPWKKYATSPVVIKAGVVQELTGAAIPEDPIEGNSCLHVEVSETTANWWQTGVLYDGLVFQAGKKYTLSAFLKCKEGTLQINFKPELSMDPWTGYGEQQFTMTDEWAEYSVTTPVFVSNVSPAQVTFHVGFAPGEFWMDNVRLIEEDDPPDIVYFTDQNLKQAVIDALAGIGIYTTDPTESQMANLTQLYAHDRGIADLTCIEHAVNLTFLDLSHNQISDISPLVGLTHLSDLNLLGNSLSWESFCVWIPTIRSNNPDIVLTHDICGCGIQDSIQMWLAAEGGDISWPMEITDDVTAFGGQFIQIISGNSKDWPPPDGRTEYGFSVPGGTYMVWGRVLAIDGKNDSFWVRIQGSTTNTRNHDSGWVKWNNITHGSDWLWDAVHSEDDGNSDVGFTLDEGSYTLEIAYREDGTMLDHLLITDYLNLSADEISEITPTGSDAEVAPVDSQTGGTPVTLTFDNVTTSGETSLTTSTSGQPVPTGFELLDTYYDIDTTAMFSRMIQIAIAYDDSGLTPEEELALKLWHYDEVLEEWTDVTIGHDTTNNIIYGETDHLSFFVITVNIVVGIDIKPGSYPNSFNMNGQGVIPVAILGSADFDVTQIDVSTLSLAGLEVRVKPNGTPQCSVEDVSGNEGIPDGYLDLVCQFIDNPDNWAPGETGEATVTGYLKEEFGGIFIEGSDEIRIVP